MTLSYEVGQLSALMKSGSSVLEKKKKKSEKLKKKAEKLNLLFSAPLPNKAESSKQSEYKTCTAPEKFESSVSLTEGKLKRKRKMKVVGEEQQKLHNFICYLENETHAKEEMPVSEEEAEKEEKATKKRKREDSESSKDFIKIDDTVNARTLFVGNLPTSFNKEDLKSLFRQFGQVESTRIRSAAPPKPSLPKKVAIIKQIYHPDVHSFNGFVVFETEEMAHAALEVDGTEIQGHHLRIDIANRTQEHDHKRSVFVGNLPFDIEDDDLWDFFQECGDVRRVRIIRDKETRIGKGFGYVLFKTMDSAALALEKNGEELKGRPLRISRSMKREKKIPRGKLRDRNELHAKRYQGKEAKKRLRVKKNKKIAKNRLLKKRKKALAEKLQATFKKNTDR